MKRANKYGFSLVELLVAVAIFTLMAGSITFAAIDSVRNVRTLEDRTRAVGLINETANLLILIKDSSWRAIMDNSDGTPKGIVEADGSFEIVDGPVSRGEYSVYFIGGPVFRDDDGNIVQTGGHEDYHTREVTITVAWKDILGVERERSTVVFVNDWNAKRWRQTTEEDFLAGTTEFTRVVNKDDGEVELQQVVYADWCKPSLSMSAYDLPGQGITRTIVAGEGEVYLGTGQNASGVSYIGISVDEADPPNVDVVGQFDGHKTNDIFGEDDYSYIATDTNAKEVVIIRTSSLPYVEVGYFDAPGPTDADSVVVDGNMGYVTTESTLYSFDLSSKNGSRPQMGTLSIAGVASSMKIRSNYLFITSNSTTEQVQIIDISDPANMAKVGWISLDAGGGVDVAVSEDFTRAYVATVAHSSKPELFVVDLTEKTGARPVIGSFDTSGMDPKGVATTPVDRLIIVGSGGQQYQVISIENELSPTKCGGMNIASGIYDVATYVNSVGTAYSYIATGDSNSEFKIIKGGLGGGGDDGQGYAEEGTFESEVFDSGSSQTEFYYVGISGEEPSGAGIRVQIRSGDQADLTGVGWVGPDGTAGSFFVVGGTQAIPSPASRNRYIQYKLTLNSNTVQTPIFEDITITYQN